MKNFLYLTFIALFAFSVSADIVEKPECKFPGFYALKENSPVFYGCYANKYGGLTMKYLQCQKGQVFSSQSGYCVPRANLIEKRDESEVTDAPDVEEPTIPTKDVENPTVPTKPEEVEEPTIPTEATPSPGEVENPTVPTETTTAPGEVENPTVPTKPTEKPETEAPETEKPETEAPATEKPETEAPETEKPETEAPATEKPETEAPETEKPETEAPATEKPETEAPETEKPETEAPATEKPETEAPATEKPETEKPETEAPEKAAPKNSKSAEEFECVSEGTFAHATDCAKYYKCQWDQDIQKYSVEIKECAKQQVYNVITASCGREGIITCLGRPINSKFSRL